MRQYDFHEKGLVVERVSIWHPRYIHTQLIAEHAIAMSEIIFS